MIFFSFSFRKMYRMMALKREIREMAVQKFRFGHTHWDLTRDRSSAHGVLSSGDAAGVMHTGFKGNGWVFT